MDAPQTHPVSGEPLYAFENEFHKLKDLMPATHRQLPPANAELDALVKAIEEHRAGKKRNEKSPPFGAPHDHNGSLLRRQLGDTGQVIAQRSCQLGILKT